MKEVTIGIDIGGTNSVMGLVDREGTIHAERSIKTGNYLTIEEFVKSVKNQIEIAINSSDDEMKIVGMGIGAPDANYFTGEIEHATNLQWEGVVPISALFKEAFNIPVALTNDANAAAMGEMIFGNAKGMKNFIEITLGTGLGSGIVINGEMLYGHTGFAGEIGHMIVEHNGRECGCGRRGCVETYVSATAICRTLSELLAIRKDHSVLRDIPPSKLNSKRVYDAAEIGDTIALEAFDITAQWLAITLSNSISFSSPEAIFLFGGLANAGDYLFKPLQKHFDTYVWDMFKNSVKILPSGLNDKNAAVLGAAALSWDELSKGK